MASGGAEPRLLGFRELCRGRRHVFGQVLVDLGGRVVGFDVLRHPGAVAVLALDERGRVLVERQYRPAVGGWVLEIPAGTLEPGEEPLEAARRELLEETGYEASRLCHMASFYPSPGVSSEVIHVYLAEGLSYRGQRLEEDEVIEVLWMEPRELLERQLEGVADAKTLIALLLYLSGRRC